MDSKLISRLRSYPSMLFLGQNYLSLTSGKNLLIEQIQRKYETIRTGYQALLELEHKGLEALIWINELSQRITAPTWLQKVAQFPWSHVYTSAVDQIWTDCFNTENWRTVQYIYNNNRFPENIRDKQNLHATFLYGSFGAMDLADKPPISAKEMRYRKKMVESALINRIPDILTPLGTLIIEGYDGEQDWYQYDDLCALIDLLGVGQVHIFSSNETMEAHPELKEYVDSGKLILHRESLYAMFQQAEDSGLLNFSYIVEQEEGKTIKVKNKVVSIPPHIWNRINRWAHVLDDLTFTKASNQMVTGRLRFNEFRNFLLDSGVDPKWEGYSQGFAFKRDCEEDLYNIIRDRLNWKSDEPIILHGQTGTGKTVMLGSIAMRLREQGEFPVVFIGKRNGLIDLNDLDAFLECLENQDSTTCLIIYDGMYNGDIYADCISFLKGRGRKRVVLVGTSYKNMSIKEGDDGFENYFPMPDKIQGETDESESESARFEAFLKKNADMVLPRNVIEDEKFIVMLYRYLPMVKPKLQAGIQKESAYTLETIKRNIKDLIVEPLNSLQLAFQEAKRKNPGSSIDPYSLTDPSERLNGEEVSKLDKLLMFVMVPAQFGLSIPIELLIRSLNVGYITNLYEILTRYDLFRLPVDSKGNIFVRARHAVEAEAICQMRGRGGDAAQADVISELIRNVADKGESDGEEIQFIVSLVVNITKNEHNYGPYNFRQHYKKFAEAFTKLREERIRRPNLILQECSLYRKYYSLDSSKTAEIGDFNTYFDNVEGIIQKGLEDSNGRTRSHLLVEFASCLRERLDHALGSDSHPRVVERLLDNIREVVSEAQRYSKRNFHAVDTLILASGAIYQKSKDEKVKLEAKAEFYRIVTVTDREELDSEQKVRFDKSMLKFADMLNDNELSGQSFERLKASGSKAGYVIRAFVPYLPNDRGLTEEETNKCRRSYDYLESVRDEIIGDERCQFMKLKYWWLSKTKKPMFIRERQLLPFSRVDWNHLYDMLMEMVVQLDNSNLKPLVLFLLGVTEFQLGYYSDSDKTFKDLDSNPEYTPRRMNKAFIATDLASQNLAAIRFEGTVVTEVRGPRGEFYVSKLSRTVPFMTSDFAKYGISKNDTLPISIAFNHRGWIAVPFESSKDVSRRR